MAGEVEKINVRSPYYLTVDSGDAPTEPETITQSLGCGQQINVGEDVGTRIYEVDVTNRSGSFSIDYTINTPIKITYQLTEDASPTVVGYLGNDEYEPLLIQQGVDVSDLTALTTGVATGSIPITRATDSESTLTITVDAPLTTDDYQISMSCPDQTTVETPPVGTPPDYEQDGDTFTLLMSFPLSHSDDPANTEMDIYVNGVLIHTIDSTELNWTVGQIRRIVFSEESGYNYAGGGSVVTVPNSEFLLNQYNDISFSFRTGTSNNAVSIGRITTQMTGLFQNPSSGNLEWSDSFRYATFNDYGYNPVPFRPVPRTSGQSIYASINFDSSTQKGFTFKPSTSYFDDINQIGNFSSYEKIINNQVVERIDMRVLSSYARG